MFSRLFRKYGAVPLVTYWQIHKKGDSVDIQGTSTVQKGVPSKGYHGNSGRVYSVIQFVLSNLLLLLL